MFPLVHIYAATKVSGKKTPLLVIGSVVPDMVWVDRKTFPPEKLHDNIDDFYSYLESNNKDLLDLALGMKLHSNDIGADKYSHFYKGGYSYIKGKELIPDLVKLVEQDESKKIADLSHNFIEAALDLHLYKIEPKMLNLYKDSVLAVDISKISKVLSDYTKINFELVFKAVQMLSEVVNPKYFATDKSMAENIIHKMIKLSFGKKVDDKEILRILKKAVKITERDYKNLFDEMIAEMKKDFKV